VDRSEESGHRGINAAKKRIQNSVVVPQCCDGFQHLCDNVSAYNWVWSADLLWPNLIDDPVAWIYAMAKALRPGGEVVVFTGNFLGSSFLANFKEEERTLQQIAWASMGLPPKGDVRHPSSPRQWFRTAGLCDSVPFAADVALDLDGADGAAVSRYLAFVAGEYKRYLSEAHGRGADLPYVELERLLTVDDEAYFGSSSGPFVHKAMYWRGEAPI
jgi:hypothetical protein